MRTAPDDRARLLDWLADHDEACPVCRYNLRGIKEALCPECGAGLTLSVAPPTAGVGPWSFAVVAFAMGLGFDAVVLLVTLGMAAYSIAVGGLSPNDWRPVLVFLTPLALLGVGSGLGLLLMFRRRRRWMLLARPLQVRAAIAIFVGVGLVHAAGGVLILYLVN